MKKLIALALVLGVASLASAALSINVGETTDTIANLDGIELVGAPNISAALLTPSTDYTLKINVTGDLSIVTSTVVFEGGWMFGNGFTGGDPGDGATAAILSAGDFSPKAAGYGAFSGLQIVGTNGTITLEEQGGGIANTIATLTVVPEPATMVLLGLGALVLRRKK